MSFKELRGYPDSVYLTIFSCLFKSYLFIIFYLIEEIMGGKGL